MNIEPTSSSASEITLAKNPAAANADDMAEVGDTRVLPMRAWDPGEVWRRFIKDARDRRERGDP